MVSERGSGKVVCMVGREGLFGVVSSVIIISLSVVTGGSSSDSADVIPTFGDAVVSRELMPVLCEGTVLGEDSVVGGGVSAGGKVALTGSMSLTLGSCELGVMASVVKACCVVISAGLIVDPCCFSLAPDVVDS